jgi:Zn-dependent peptidase ImmA (M78 family)
MARLSELLSEVDLAAFAGKASVAEDRLAAIVAGAEPSVGEARRIASALKLPLSALLSRAGGGEPSRAELLFRGATAPGKADIAAQRIAARVDASMSLARNADNASIPWWWSRFERGAHTALEAERNAATFRRLLYEDDQLGPLLSLPTIATDRMGVMLFVMNASEIDGASSFLDGVPYVFVSARFQGRMLFTLAHELGHLIAHHDPATSFAVVDEDVEAVRPQAHRTREQYADAFASALLMPQQGLGIALKKVREIAKTTDKDVGDLEINYLARIFGVSFWAAARRCEALGVIPSGGAAALNEHLVKQYGSAEKRAESAGLPPRPDVFFPPVPSVLVHSAVNQVRRGDLSLGRAAELLEMSMADILTINAPTAH